MEEVVPLEAGTFSRKHLAEDGGFLSLAFYASVGHEKIQIKS